MKLQDFINAMANQEIITEVKNLGRKVTSISVETPEGDNIKLYTTDFPLTWPDADCVTVALGDYMSELN
jgi:hypothetical protein